MKRRDLLFLRWIFPPHRRVTEEKPKKEGEPNKKEAKKEIEVVASIATKKIAAPVKKKAKSPPVKTKKTTNLEDKPAPRIVRKVGTQDCSAITERWSEVKKKKV